MIELDAASILDYLTSRGHVARGEAVFACELSGGVSNKVMRIRRADGEDWIIKQARERLNVAEPWHCGVERIWREVDALRACDVLILRAAWSGMEPRTPRVLFEDRENYLYAMSAVPEEHAVWKAELMAGRFRAEVAQACGAMLGAIHAGSWHDPELAAGFDDREYFDRLRLDPYYRHVARVRPDFAAAMTRLVDSVSHERHTLAHGDFSPKNLLAGRDRLTLLDYEVGHYGDPAFDVGFFLAHLVLKAWYHAPKCGPLLRLVEEFLATYQDQLKQVLPDHEVKGVLRRGWLHLAGCLMARLDGKSQIEYLGGMEARAQVRETCRAILATEPATWRDVRRLIAAGLTHSW